MSATWMTKYGPRRVRHEPPTLEEALFAAADLALDKAEQIQIAAKLMQVPVEQIRVAAERIVKDQARRTEIVPARRPGSSGGAVVVERKAPRRFQVETRKGSFASRGA